MKNSLISKYGILSIMILVLLLLISFATKAFHIDDTLVLYSARQITKTSLSGFPDTVINWLGIPQNIRTLSDSPLITRYAALIIGATGESELWLHIFFLIFPIIAIISMYFLSKRFTGYPLISTLL